MRERVRAHGRSGHLSGHLSVINLATLRPLALLTDVQLKCMNMKIHIEYADYMNVHINLSIFGFFILYMVFQC